MTRLRNCVSILHLLLLITPHVSSSPATISKFNATDDDDDDKNWAIALRKGRFLQQQMESGCFPDIKDPITLPQLEALGFQIGHDASSKWPPKFGVLRVFNDLVMEKMGWSEGMDYWTTDCQRRFPGTTPPLRTDYFNSFSPHNGLIAALENRKPAPETTHWSDFTFALWLAVTTFAKASPRNLRYIARHEIDNPFTKSIVFRAVAGASRGRKPPYRDDVVTFERGTQGFKALLGTPNGAGAVFLLMQHKRWLGWKRVERVVVFPNGMVFPDLVFLVGEVRGEVSEADNAGGVVTAREEGGLGDVCGASGNYSLVEGVLEDE